MGNTTLYPSPFLSAALNNRHNGTWINFGKITDRISVKKSEKHQNIDDKDQTIERKKQNIGILKIYH